MDPNIVIANSEEKIKKVRKMPNSKVILIVLVLLVWGFVAFLYFNKGSFYTKKGKLTSFVKNLSTTPTPILSPKAKIDATIKQTFATKDTKDVITYLNRALAEKEATKSYNLYKQTFTEMSNAYLSSKNITYKYAMIDLKTFLSTFSMYKQQDFVIPK